MLLVLDVSDEVLAHLVRAVALYRRQLRVDGLGAVPAWEQFAAAVGTKPDHACQDTPTLDEATDWSDTPPREPPLLLDKRQVGQLLNVSDRSVSRLIASGELPVVKIGARSLIRRSDVVAFVGGLDVDAVEREVGA